MRKCIACDNKVEGRTDKIFCSSYCKSNYHYLKNLEKEKGFYVSVDKQLKFNRRLLKHFNQSGKSIIRKQKLLSAGFNPRFFTHYWKNPKGEVYLFCYEFGFLELREHQISKYVLIDWQDYMSN